MRISLIAAVAADRVIGANNALPWRLPADLAHFKRTTMGHTLLMGRKTFDSIGRALPGRTTIVLTRQPFYLPPAGVRVARDLDEAIALCATNESVNELANELFVAGGAEVYALALPRAARMFLTMIEARYPGDAYFPAFDPSDWELISRERGDAGDGGVPPFAFEVYHRRR